MRRTPPRGLGFSNPNKPDDARNRAIADAIDAIQADPVLALFVAFLARLTVNRRRAAIWSFEFWLNDLLSTDRAKIVRMYRSNATEAEVARWSGVSERSLHRWTEYKDVRRAARGEWPVGYKDRDGQFDAWVEPDG
jgi:hypothetical protein